MSSESIHYVQLVLRILVALAFIAMGVTHFLPSVQRTMAAMIPPRLRVAGPFNPHNLVVITGVCEIAGGLGLLYPPTTVLAGAALVVFLVAVFPANAYAAAHKKRFGAIAVPLVPRLLAQVAMIALIVLAIV